MVWTALLLSFGLSLVNRPYWIFKLSITRAPQWVQGDGLSPFMLSVDKVPTQLNNNIIII